MKKGSSTTKVVFCCPKHGELSTVVEYVDVILGLKKLVDVPVMFCEECKIFYTPFSNLLSFTKLQFKGYPVGASKAVNNKKAVHYRVATPRWINSNPQNGIHIDPHLQKSRPRICGYEIVPLAGLNKEYFKKIITLTNAPRLNCPACRSKTVEYVNFLEVNQAEAIRIPGHYCLKCDRFFAEDGDKLTNMLEQSKYEGIITLDKQFFVSGYSRKIQEAKKLKSGAIAIHIANKDSNEHRLITIVTEYSDKMNKPDVFHYRDFLARKLLYVITKDLHSFQLAREAYEILDIIQLDKKEENFIEHLKVEKIVFRKGGGLYGGIAEPGIELVDVLMCSPFSECFEIVHASYDRGSKTYYMDTRVFREYVAKYGNPGVRVEIYCKGDGDYSTLAEESILHAYGYVVGLSGLPKKERQVLLSEVIDLKIISAERILALLDFNISNHKKAEYEMARMHWAEDKQFVMTYKVNPDRFVISSWGL